MNKNKSECGIIITREAFAKMKAITGHKDEVAAMCITKLEQPNKVVDIFIPEQESNPAYFEFNSDQYGAAIEHLVMDVGYELSQVCKVMIHSHPGNSNVPSGTDWENFNALYGEKELPVMLIISKDHKISAHTILPLYLWNGKMNLEISVSIEEEAFDVSLIKEDIKKKVKPYVYKKPTVNPSNYLYNGYKDWSFWDNIEKYEDDFCTDSKKEAKKKDEPLIEPHLSLEIANEDMEMIKWFGYELNDIQSSKNSDAVDNLIELLNGAVKNSKCKERDIATILVTAYANDIYVENGLYYAFIHLLLADHIQDDRDYLIELYQHERGVVKDEQEC